MANYVYLGQAPEVDPDGGLARPLDEREFDEPPGWGLWALTEEPGGIKSEADPADIPEPPPPGVAAHLAEVNAPPLPVATLPATAPDAKGGM